MTRYLSPGRRPGCQMGAYEHALEYAQERLQFGKPIGSFQLVQDLLARMIANVTASSVPGRAHGATPCRRQAEGRIMRRSPRHSAPPGCARRSHGRASCSAATAFVPDYQVARFFADAEALYSYEGTYQMQNLIVGKAITGLSAFV